mmetsp:Transcript_28654/g.39575  ORF Transcript_28654/g.39575 Transcript_28654/m.39575 type:complete len:206 (-) Transcript_28654:316-933(-)
MRALSTPRASSADNKCSTVLISTVPSELLRRVHNASGAESSGTDVKLAGMRTSPLGGLARGCSWGLIGSQVRATISGKSSCSRCARSSSSNNDILKYSTFMSSFSSSDMLAVSSSSSSSSSTIVPSGTITKYLPSPAKAGRTRTVTGAPECSPTPERVKEQRTVCWNADGWGATFASSRRYLRCHSSRRLRNTSGVGTEDSGICP